MAKRKQPSDSEISMWLDVADGNVEAASASLADWDGSGAMTADELRAAQRRLVLLARNATAAAAMLYGVIRQADSQESAQRAKG